MTSALEEDTGFDEIMDKVMKKYIQTKGESIENDVFKANIRLDSYNLKKENTEGINKIKKEILLKDKSYYVIFYWFI